MAIARILRHAVQGNSKQAFAFCNENFEQEHTISYSVLGEKTRRLAEQLLKCRDPNGAQLLKAGDRVLLVFLPSLEFIITFIACIRAGLVAVPVYPPDPRNLRMNISLFTSICQSCGATVALSHAPYTQVISLGKLKDTAMGLFGRSKDAAVWPELTWLTVDSKSLSLQGERSPGENSSGAAGGPGIGIDQAAPTDLAFLQYTSGSTSEPKGVRLTHACLGANIDEIIHALRAGPDTVVVSWLPQYHDMGLIGSYLALAACGGTGYYASPLTFIKRPVQWLVACSRYRATHVQAPNFAYALCARKLGDAIKQGQVPTATFDLSSLRHAFNAAEPVTAAAIKQFLSAFRPYGFRAAALQPGYGLAEHTVFVSVGGQRVLAVARQAVEAEGRAVVRKEYSLQEVEELAAADLVPDRDTALYVSCGPVYPYCQPSGSTSGVVGEGQGASGTDGSAAPTGELAVVIVNPEDCTMVIEEGVVGEVWLHSPSVADGYYSNPSATAAAFGVPLVTPPTTTAPNGRQTDGKGGEADVKNAGIEEKKLPATSVQTWISSLSVHPSSAPTWLRTGDLAFIHRGELYITGRLKDLIILRGRNFYPSDIEQCIEACEPRRLRPGCTAVFAVVDGATDGAVAAVEVRPEVPPQELLSMATNIRQAVSLDFGIRLTAVLLLRPHGVQKTTSGKVARKWNARAWDGLHRQNPASPWVAKKDLIMLLHKSTEAAEEEDAPPDAPTPAAATGASTSTGGAPVAHAPAPSAALDWTGKKLLVALCQDIGHALGIEASAVDVRVAVSALGLDSLALMQFQQRMVSRYGLAVRDDLMWWEGCTLTWIASQAKELRRPYEEQNLAGAPAQRAGPGAAAPPIAPSAAVPPPRPTPGLTVRSVVVVGEEQDEEGQGGADLTLRPEDFREGAFEGQAAQGKPRRRRKGPSSFEQNFPCLVCCIPR